MVIIYTGKRVRIRKVIDRRGRIRYYKSIRNKPFRPVKRKSAVISVARIKGWKTRTKREQRARELKEMDRRMEERAKERLFWFVGRTSQPAPNGYIIVVGAFDSSWTQEDMIDHVQRVLGISFVETWVKDFIPANYTYVYDLKGRNVTSGVLAK